MEPDFGGYATKAGLRCSDGRVIKAAAFQHMDGKKVPLVYQHGHKDMANVLGHVLLEARPDGVYARGFFNESPNGQNAKMAVSHGDLDSLSIWANQLQEINKVVSHGSIKEVSLVLAGANPGAKIDQVRIQHSADEGDYDELADEAIITHMGEIELPTVGEEVTPVEDNKTESDKVVESEPIEHADAVPEMTIKDVYDSMSEDEKTAVHYMVGVALQEAEAKKSDSGTSAEHSDTTDEGIAHQEGTTDMARNLFEQQGAGTAEAETPTLSHADRTKIFKEAARLGSLKMAVADFFAHAEADENSLAHGVTNIDILFPDAKNITGAPELDKRRTEWVQNVLAGTRHTPFSRIKTFAADLTQDEARAKGYIKGNFKLEEWFGVTQRSTTPTTVYKKQKIDRDDLLDITEFDMVAFLKTEMRLMTEEEIATAILIGDGRSTGAEDKVKDPAGASSGAGIRSILNDHEYYVTTLNANVDDANSSYEEVIDLVMDGQEYLKGTGVPTFYTTIPQLNKFMKAKDANGRRYYETRAAVASALGVDQVVTCEVLKRVPNLIGIIVNLADYNVGTDAGGELTMFDDFDIDYNQNKYLLETRLSGALVRPKAALVIMATAVGNVLVAPVKPAFVASTGVVTIPSVTGVVYKASDGTTTLSAGAQTAISAGVSETLYAVPASGYYFADTVNDSWQFTRPAS
jgi:HK97 family phage prohead protease